MNIITVINAKGGCGKSTIAMSLAAGLADRGFPTLLIDMDPQAQVTQWLGAGDGLNAVTLQATGSDGFSSKTLDRLTEKRTELDPFMTDHYVEDHTGYGRLAELSDSRLGRLIDLLVVECVTAHLQRRTELVHLLAGELKVDFRRSWRPDAPWLAGYQKIQLAHLATELRGGAHDPATDTAKKSDLVDYLATIFGEAADGKLKDKALAERANAWLPVNLRHATAEELSVSAK